MVAPSAPRRARVLDSALLFVALFFFNIVWFIPRLRSPIWGLVLAIPMTCAMWIARHLFSTRRGARSKQAAGRRRFVAERAEALFWLPERQARDECLSLLANRRAVSDLRHQADGTLCTIEGQRVWFECLQHLPNNPPSAERVLCGIRRAHRLGARAVLLALCDYPASVAASVASLSPPPGAPRPVLLDVHALDRWLPAGSTDEPELPRRSWRKLKAQLLSPSHRNAYIRCAFLLVGIHLLVDAWYMLPVALASLIAAMCIRPERAEVWP